MNNDKKFPEQDAPAKNTDNAFVQVGEDGAPVMPKADDIKSDRETQVDSTSEEK